MLLSYVYFYKCKNTEEIICILLIILRRFEPYVLRDSYRILYKSEIRTEAKDLEVFDIILKDTRPIPYYSPSQLYSEPSFIPRPEEICGFKIYICKRILSFNDGGEAGSKINWNSCCGSSDLKKQDQNSLNDKQLNPLCG
jgi:hypothetical protein